MALKYGEGTKFVFHQDADSCDSNIGGGQLLEIELHDAGGGIFATIKSERWAVDVDELPTLMATIEECIKKATSIFEEKESIKNELDAVLDEPKE